MRNAECGIEREGSTPELVAMLEDRAVHSAFRIPHSTL